MIGLGLVLTQLLLPLGGFATRDESINRWLADHRDPTLEHLSWIGSTLAGGVVIPVVVGACLVALLAFRRWRLAAFVLFVICIESGAYRATTLVIHRDRPDVDRLESLPVDASFPSGHTAAALALYGGLLLVLASWARRTTVTVAACALLVAIPLFVAWARMYRGMHHLTDSVAGLLLGAGALVVTVFAARAAGAAAARRDARGSIDGKRERA
jgi:undecaprenyl-diphosphatase